MDLVFVWICRASCRERKKGGKKSLHAQFGKPFTQSTWPAVSHSFIQRPEATAFARQQRVEKKTPN